MTTETLDPQFYVKSRATSTALVWGGIGLLLCGVGAIPLGVAGYIHGRAEALKELSLAGPLPPLPKKSPKDAPGPRESGAHVTTPPPVPTPSQNEPRVSDSTLRLALARLQYKGSEITAVLPKVPEGPIEERVKLALRLLGDPTSETA